MDLGHMNVLNVVGLKIWWNYFASNLHRYEDISV